MHMSTADLYDEHGEALQSCSLQFRQYGSRRAFHGTITTLRCHEDNALLKSILEEPGNGRALVVDGGGSLEAALLGDVIAGTAAANGWAGVVVNGAVRDVVALAAIDLGVKALGSNPRKSHKHGLGTRDVAVIFGGVMFHPGATIYSDDDGILVTTRGR
ncbi:ribonuclease E activity regulator RraA [Herbidospora daliensis]|uniref:ribonuclease E activity regulator RraA n=1 Tax=Herbidospora daliensis TaxID=295585 RepID=UPI00078210C1|nr:ribonuclease E activity regulator RraA [Herbidospora daliensis]